MSLSGRVDTLENQVTFITQDLLQKIDLVASNSQSVTWNQQLDSIETSLLTMTAQLQTLQSLYTNLYLTVRTNYNEFTGHTGAIDTDTTALAETVATLDPEYAAMYQTGATIYDITGAYIGSFIGSVGATGACSKGVDIQLFESIGGPGSFNPPQDQFVVNQSGVYRFSTTFSIQALSVSPGNVALIDAAFATGNASGVVLGTDFQFELSSQGEDIHSVPINMLMNLNSGDNVMLVGKSNTECSLQILTSLMSIEKVSET